MLKSEEIIKEIIEDIESSIKRGFDNNAFIKKFRNRIEQFITDKIS